MSNTFAKLNYKNQPEILVLDAPQSFEAELAALGDIVIRRTIAAMTAIEFSLAFVTRQSDVDSFAAAIAARTRGDATVWFAYPKGSSKNYRCEFNRDTGWAMLGELGFEPVRQIAIDDDWSALRFRRVEYIKSLTRSPQMALTTTGKKRVAKE